MTHSLFCLVEHFSASKYSNMYIISRKTALRVDFFKLQEKQLTDNLLQLQTTLLSILFNQQHRSLPEIQIWTVDTLWEHY